MPKPKPKPKPKAKSKTTLAPAQKKKIIPPAPPTTLTKVQEYYIEGNREVRSEAQIAQDLDIPITLVHEFIEKIQKDVHTSRVSSLLQRPAKGAVAMTEAASMAGDDLRGKNLITQAEINKAAANGDYHLAARLTELKKNQQGAAIDQQVAKYSDCWHFINPPESKP